MLLEQSLKGLKVLPKLRRTDRFSRQIQISPRALVTVAAKAQGLLMC